MLRRSSDRVSDSLASLRRVKFGWQWCLPLLGLAFVVRLFWLFAAPTYDLITIVGCMRAMTHGGISEVLTSISDRIHLPWELYLLLLPGWFCQGAAAGSGPTLVELMAVRLSMIFTDVLATAAIYRIGRRSTTPAIALAGALLYALWPGGIYVNSWWTQSDIWYVVPIVVGAWWLSQKRVEIAWLALALGMGEKWQAAMVLPIFIVGTWRWYGWRKLVIGGLVAGGVWGLSVAPIIIKGEGSQFLSKSTVQILAPYLVDKAHNFWFAVVPAARVTSFHALDTNPSAWGASFHDVGVVLAGLTMAVILSRIFWRSGPRSIAAASGLGVMAATMFLTQISTRHYLAAPAFFLLAGFFDRKWWGLGGLLITTQLINLVWESGAISPLWGIMPIPLDVAVANAWCNLAILGLGLVLFLWPVTNKPARQAESEGPLQTMRPPLEPALLGLGMIGLIAASTVILWWGGQLGKPILRLRDAYYASLDEVLTDATLQNHILVINWPEKISADAPGWMKYVPMTLSAVQLHWPDILMPQTQRVQFGPWQRASPGTRVEFNGNYVTASELRDQVLQAERVIDFHPASSEVYMLAERLPASGMPPCWATFDAGICLVEAAASQHGSEVRLDLTWEVTRQPARDMTVFVHATSPDGEMLAQADGDLVQNIVPLADWPAQNGLLREARWMTLSADSYQIWVGIYNRATGERASLTCSGANTCSETSIMVSASQGP